MTEWELNITYGLKPHTLKAVLEYESNQVMRIRVHGSKSALLLETDYPLIRLAKSKRGMKWKIREGAMDNGNPQAARLLTRIIEILERILRKEFPAVAY